MWVTGKAGQKHGPQKKKAELGGTCKHKPAQTWRELYKKKMWWPTFVGIKKCHTMTQWLYFPHVCQQNFLYRVSDFVMDVEWNKSFLDEQVDCLHFERAWEWHWYLLLGKIQFAVFVALIHCNWTLVTELTCFPPALVGLIICPSMI